MKHLKMLGLAAIAALSLMALVGAGTASATTLATDSAGTVKYGAGTELHLSLGRGTSWTLTDTSGNTIATCTGVTVKGNIGTATGTWVSTNLSTLAFEGCNQTTDTLKPGNLEIMQATGDEGIVASKNNEVTLSIFGVSCVYGTGEGTTLGVITGDQWKVTAVVPRIAGGFLCPSTAIWHAANIITSPHALHIVS